MKVISKYISVSAGALITANSVVADLNTSSITGHTLIDICSGNECGITKTNYIQPNRFTIAGTIVSMEAESHITGAVVAAWSVGADLCTT